MNADDVAVLAIVLTAIGIVIALIAIAAAIYAIRRDRPVLRARWADGAAGTIIVSIVNVGLRPVRVEQLIRREGWIRPHDRDYSSLARFLDVTPLPVIVEPGHEVIAAIANEDMHERRGRWFLVDAAERHHAIRPAVRKYIRGPYEDDAGAIDPAVEAELAALLAPDADPSSEAARDG